MIVVCLLLFAQCSSQASLSDDVAALKKQLQEVKDKSKGSTEELKHNLEQQIQGAEAATKTELTQLRNADAATKTELTQLKNADVNTKTELVQLKNADTTKSFKEIISAMRTAIDESSKVLNFFLKKELKVEKQTDDLLNIPTTSSELDKLDEGLVRAVEMLRLLDFPSGGNADSDFPTEIFYSH